MAGEASVVKTYVSETAIQAWTPSAPTGAAPSCAGLQTSQRLEN
jgi:hypothetical protein